MLNQYITAQWLNKHFCSQRARNVHTSIICLEVLYKKNSQDKQNGIITYYCDTINLKKDVLQEYMFVTTECVCCLRIHGFLRCIIFLQGPKRRLVGKLTKSVVGYLWAQKLSKYREKVQNWYTSTLFQIKSVFLTFYCPFLHNFL